MSKRLENLQNTDDLNLIEWTVVIAFTGVFFSLLFISNVNFQEIESGSSREIPFVKIISQKTKEHNSSKE